MRRLNHIAKALALALALLAGVSGGQELAPAPPPPAPDQALILYIPSNDLPRAPGYSKEGAMAPLSELLALASRAAAMKESEAAPSGLTLTELALNGTVSDSLILDGALKWQGAGEAWAAAVLDDGAWPWTLVESGGAPGATGESTGLLVRSGGKTVLLAKGRGTGQIPVRAVWNLDPMKSAEDLALGVINAPARIELRLAAGTAINSTDNGVLSMDDAAADGSRLAVLRPLPGLGAVIHLRRAPVLDEPESAAAIHTLWLRRRVVADSGALQVIDTLTMKGRFKKGEAVELTLPPNLKLLNTFMQGPADHETRDDKMIITPREDFDSLQFQSQFMVKMAGDGVEIRAWNVPALQQRATLYLAPVNFLAPVPDEIPAALIPAEAHKGASVYEVWGALPPMRFRLSSRMVVPAPALQGELRLLRSEATLKYVVLQFDPRLGELAFRSPEGWTLSGARVMAREAELGWSLVQSGDDRWRLIFGTAKGADSVILEWHRAGSWGAPGQSASVALPLISVDGPPPLTHKMLVHWPEEFDVRTEALRNLFFEPISPGDIRNQPQIPQQVGNPFSGAAQPGMVQAQVQSQIAEPQADSPELILRAEGDDPAGSLDVRGRESSLRATVVTMLSLDEERARARVMIEFAVRFAPASTFRFALPAGTGQGVKIGGEGIRESSMQSDPEGDVWTIVTQQAVLGSFRATAEWTLAASPAGGAVEAPEIRALGVAAQRGFIVLEGSETLRLIPDTKNLAEADLVDLPQTPWSRNIRALAIYRYIEPPYSLTVKTDKFMPIAGLDGLIEEARLKTAAGADGQRLTRAEYRYRPVADRQFFDITLPKDAQLWAALVDGRGTKPARAAGSTKEQILIPLPGQAERGATIKIEIIYREQGEPLAQTGSLRLPAPAPVFPVNRTAWELNLPPGFEYLRFEGALIDPVQPRQTALSFLRTAYYPDRLVFVNAALSRIIIASLFLLFAYWVAMRIVRSLRDTMAQGPKPPKPQGGGVSHAGMTIIQLFIVLGIVAILAAIAVPNFLEAQVRSKVSRVKSDMRSLATAIEAYMVDNNAYPVQQEVLWQGPVKYISGGPRDPYSGSGSYESDTYKYVFGSDAQRRAIEMGLVSPADTQQLQWLAYSVGPDGKDDMGMTVYDPTNGTVSVGDIVRTNLGADTLFRGTFTQMHDQELSRERMAASSAVAPASAPMPSPAIEGQAMSGIDVKPEAEEDLSQTPQVGAGFMNLAANVNGEVRFVEFNADDGLAQSFGGMTFRVVGDAARQAGLLSLAVEIPEGGVQRRLEALGAESELTVNFMPWERFKRAQFIVWIAALLVMAALWIRASRAARVAFVVAIAAMLLTPVIVKTAWVPFFNAALQGVLFSLVVPLMGVLWRLTLGRGHHDSANHRGPVRPARRGAAATTIISILLLLPVMSAQADDVIIEPTPNAVTIIVPYQPDSPPMGEADPLGWMSRVEFTRLWEAAQAGPVALEGGRPYLAALRLDGALDAESGVVAGLLIIDALNAGDAPGELPLKMAGLTIESVTGGDNGAALHGGADGLRLQMPAHWSGRIEARFTWRVNLQGREGSLAIEFPEAGAGAWTVKMPWPRVEITSRETPALIREAPDGATISGTIRPGPMALAWRGDVRSADVPASGTDQWRADVHLQYTWEMLSAAAWQADIVMQPVEAGGLLPQTAQLSAGAGLVITGAAGAQLKSARLPGVEGGDVILEMLPSSQATVTLSGYVVPVDPQRWSLPALLLPEGIDGPVRVSLHISDQIEVINVETEGLTRQTPLGAMPRHTSQVYSAVARKWSAALSLRRLRPEFDAASTDLRFPRHGFIWSAARIEIKPRASMVNGARIELPDGAQAMSVESAAPHEWVQSGRDVWVNLTQPVEQPITIDVLARMPSPVSAETLEFSPLRVIGAREHIRRLAIGTDRDIQLSEKSLGGAEPTAQGPLESELAQKIEPLLQSKPETIRVYELRGDEPLQFRLTPIKATAQVQTFNLVTISEGLQSLHCELKARPRAGRIQSVEAILLLPEPDPEAASRLETTGPVRHVEKVMLSDTMMRISAELNGPVSGQATLRLQLDLRANTEDGQALRVPVILPMDGSGARATLQVRRVFEGEIALADSAGAAALDRAEVQKGSTPFGILPADQFFSLNLKGETAPSFRITRHARQQALRAIVEVLRERVILTADGLERHELEIVLQNQSEQFLRVALPYPSAQVKIYEARVAGRVVKTTFAKEGGREALLLPLIRTGLLEPELTVRVVYTVAGQPPMSGRGERRQALPDILGGVPVVQSALVLMLPDSFKYGGFDGTLNRVDLVDIELDEVVRRAKKLEQISEAALYTEGETQARALSKVQAMQKTVEFGVSKAKQTVEAYGRNIDNLAQSEDKSVRDEATFQQQFAGRRNASLEEAQMSQMNYFSNAAKLNEIVIQQGAAIPVQMEAALEPAAVFAEPMEFPRSGTVYVFRQVQGTGFITLDFASRESASRLWDLLFGAMIVIGVGLVAGLRRQIFATQRRVGAVIVVVCVAAICFKAALDLAIPGAVIGLIIWLTGKAKKKEEEAVMMM